MAALTNERPEYPIRINDDGTIQFGNHLLPIGTAKEFFIHSNPQDPSVYIILDTYRGDPYFLKYRMKTLTIPKMRELVNALFTKTQAMLIQQFKKIDPTVRSFPNGYRGEIVFQFALNEETTDFVHFFSPQLASKDFDVFRENQTVRFIAKKGGIEQTQVNRVKEVLEKLCLKISDHEVERSVNQSPDARFRIVYSEPKIASARSQEYHYVVTPNEISEMYGSQKEQSTQPIFEFVNGPSKTDIQETKTNLEKHWAQFDDSVKASVQPFMDLLTQIVDQQGAPTLEQLKMIETMGEGLESENVLEKMKKLALTPPEEKTE